MRLLVCGGRDFVDVPLLWRTLDAMQSRLPEPGITLVIDGASDDVTGPYMGADYWAHQWALARGLTTVREHAKWSEQGKAAGPLRNREMMVRHRPDRVIAFPGKRGTANLIEQAEQRGVMVQRVNAAVFPQVSEVLDEAWHLVSCSIRGNLLYRDDHRSRNGGRLCEMRRVQ